MNIEIDLSLLKENHLSPDDYIFLYLIWRKGFNTVESIPLRIKATRLEHDGWITLNDELDHTKFVVQQKFKDLYLADADKMFEELVELYPFKVLSPTRGARVLRAKDPNSMSNKKAKNRYKRIIQNKPHLHRYIIKCLKTQLEHEKDNLGYMQNLDTWINNHTWEKYEDVNLKTNQDDRRITRKL
jgi:hypothetical protein|tara:strand:+ start:1525 stop:2079 length:555 start_codon:yes stop_codon:yes gene_type:complete